MTTALATSVRWDIDHGTKCFLCGEPKRLGVDYCDRHLAEEWEDRCAAGRLQRAEAKRERKAVKREQDAERAQVGRCYRFKGWWPRGFWDYECLAWVYHFQGDQWFEEMVVSHPNWRHRAAARRAGR